jgi:hypothetical protein
MVEIPDVGYRESPTDVVVSSHSADHVDVGVGLVALDSTSAFSGQCLVRPHDLQSTMVKPASASGSEAQRERRNRNFGSYP